MKWIKSSSRLPTVNGLYHMRRIDPSYVGDGDYQKWTHFVVPHAINKAFWISEGWEWLDETALPTVEEIAGKAFDAGTKHGAWHQKQNLQSAPPDREEYLKSLKQD